MKIIPQSPKRGFTLMEFIWVVLIVGGAIFGLVYINVTSLQAAQDTRVRFLVMKGILEYELNYLCAQPFNVLVETPPNPPTPGPGWRSMSNPPGELPPTAALPEIAAAFSCADCRLQYKIIEQNANLRLIGVVASWTGPSGHQRYQEIYTAVTGP